MEAHVEGSQIAAQTIRDLREVENLRAVWKSWQGTRDSDLDFFCATVRNRGATCRPHVILLTRNGRPEALLVGLRERTKIHFRLCSFAMYQPEVSVLEFVYGGLLGNTSKENCAALVQVVMQSLAEGDADVALWEQLDVKSALYTCALQYPNLVLRDHAPCLHDHWFMNFPKGLDALLLSLGRSQRSKLRRKYRRVLNSFDGRIQVQSFRTVADLEEAISKMEEVASKSFKRRLGQGFFDTASTREQLRVEATRGWLRVYILYFEQKPVAFWQGTLYRRCLQADHVAYDSAWSAFSPGTFLFLAILEQLRDEDIETVDFGLGNLQLHQSFGNLRQVEARVQIYAPKLVGLQLNLLHTLTHYGTGLIRRIPCLTLARKAVRDRLQARLPLSRERPKTTKTECGLLSS
jgi:hypothetical protein